MNKPNLSKPKKSNCSEDPLAAICKKFFEWISLAEYKDLLNETILSRLDAPEDANFPAFMEKAKEDIYHFQQLSSFLERIHAELVKAHK